MIEDLLVDPAPGPFEPGDWDLSGVGFSDDPLEVVHDRVAKHLRRRGYVDLGQPASPLWHRGAMASVDFPRKVCAICEDVTVEALRPGVYRVDMAFRMPYALASLPERAFRHGELAALVAVVEGRDALIDSALERAADARLAHRADIVRQVLIAVLGGLVLSALGIAVHVFSPALFAVPFMVMVGRVVGESRKERTEAEALRKPRPPATERDLRLLERSIATIGYWRAWSNEVGGRFDVLFSHTQIWSPRRPSGRRPAGPLCLRLQDPTFVAFTSPPAGAADGEASPLADWPRLLASSQLPALALLADGVRIDTRTAVDEALATAPWRALIGEVPPPPRQGERTLVLRTSTFGLVVVASGLGIHTAAGQLTPRGAAVLHQYWVRDWLRYWRARLRDEAVEYDAMNELQVPLHPDLAETGILALTLSGPPGL